MVGCSAPGRRVYVTRARANHRRLPYTWEIIAAGRVLVSVNPWRANRVAAGAVAAGALPELTGYARWRREARYTTKQGGTGRADLLLDDPTGGRAPCYVEVKSVTLVRDRVAMFPDAVSARGQRQLLELAALRRAGARAVVLFLVARCDCERFAPATDIDPGFAEALRAAAREGVEPLAYRCRVRRDAQRIERALPIDL